jgi:trimethylamine--corrinoid protein Co-methyltransferase
MIADTVNNCYRESTAQDLYDLSRIVDTCEHIHIFQRMCVLRDIEDNYEMDLNTTYCSVTGTSKHVGASWTDHKHLEKTLEMLHIIAGGEDKWRARPFVSQSNCFVVPPMKFAEEALECLRVAVEGGMPVLLLSAGQAGATTPACLAGAVSQAWAEILGGLVYVNAIKPGAPAILGAWPFISDLRTGSMSGGSPEQGLLSAACAQMGVHFDLPFGTACGMTDTKMPDFQGGAERAQTLLAPALAGANIIYECGGMYASLLGACPESLLIDNDVLGGTLRITRGIEVDETTLSFENMKEVCLSGEGHYLGSDRTLAVMQSEYIYPDFSDRTSPNVWEENGKPELLDKAVAKKNKILASHFPKHISDETDAEIRRRFPIHLSPESVGRG